ncbi:hypothetical protein PFISCL1PPCAC_25758, partial [Pristionchus fissidentatus]
NRVLHVNFRFPLELELLELPLIRVSNMGNNLIEGAPLEGGHVGVSRAANRTEAQLLSESVVRSLVIKGAMVDVSHAGEFVGAIARVQIAS